MLRRLAVVAGGALALACAGGPSKDDTAADTADLSPTPVDLVVVFDNSASMDEAAGDLGLALQSTLGAFGDIPLKLTLLGISPGEERGQPVGPSLEGTGAQVAAAMASQLWCLGSCWQPSELPSDPSHSCEDPITRMSAEALDCACGFGAWEGHCGSGMEEPLESMFLLACRASDSPGPTCSDGPYPLESGELSSLPGFFREGAHHAFLVVTDEGDTSSQLPQGDSDASPYLNLLAALVPDPLVFVIGPDWSDGAMTCNSGGATTWGVERQQQAAQVTGGAYWPISQEQSGECTLADLEATLQQLVTALGG